MNKSAYSRRLNPLIAGKGNFITESQEKLSVVVRQFVDTAFSHYALDGNVKHVEGASLAMSYLMPHHTTKTQSILFKAFKDLRGNHYKFEMVIPLLDNGTLNPLEHTFKYEKLDKKLKPAVLPSLELTLREVNQALDKVLVRTKGKATAESQAASALKRTTNGMMDFPTQLVALKAMGLEDRKAWIEGTSAMLLEADKLQNPAKYTATGRKKATPKAKVNAKAPRKASVRKGKAASATKVAGLKEKMEGKKAA